jgi:lipoprotein-releasing system permease protein
MAKATKNKVNSQIASVHLTSKIWQTVVAMLGVTFGVSMYIFMNTFMNGVNSTQDDLAFSNLPHIRINNETDQNTYNPAIAMFGGNSLVNIRNRKSIQSENNIRNTAQVMSVLKHQKDISEMTPQLNVSVFFRSGAKKINGTVSGVEADTQDRMFGSAAKVIEGKWSELNYQKPSVILGFVLAQNLGVKVNDNVNILTSDGVSKNYTVAGLIETSVKDVDKSKAYMNIGTTRQLLGKNSDYSSDIMVNLVNRNETSRVKAALQPSLKYNIETWQDANQQLLAASQMRSIIAFAVSFTILLVAGFGIYNIMNMTINEKIREIAILKAMGFSGKDILSIFLMQASIIGLLGAVSGLILGVVLSTLINLVPFKIAGLTTLPIMYKTQDFVLAVLFGMLTTLLAGYLPARKASKIDPVAIIRG